ncbi:Valine--tRNA ligase, partial [Caligus rogercresseyi]
KPRKRPRRLLKKAAKLAKLEAKKNKVQEESERKAGKEPKAKKNKAGKESSCVIYDSPTVDGEKKDPRYVESAWYSWWESSGFFKPEYGGDPSKDPFVIMIPPPNVTGKLHLGHALTNAIQDCIVTSPSGTRAAITRDRHTGHWLSRHDLGREGFLKRVWEWKENYGATIYGQLKRLGRLYMDPKMSLAVTEAFIRLHDEGVIYR